jgi:polysaccharide deacetylase family protein (PEP-CTERM system associated)
MATPTGVSGPTAEPVPQAGPSDGEAGPVILSFDVEEHFRIEAAAGLAIDPALKAHYGERLEPSVRWLLDQLGRRGIRATFFVVGEIGRSHPELIRAMHRDGHEVASHSWDHRRLHHLTPEAFREDLRRTREMFEQLTGQAVVGYRAPTFSVMRETAWAIDVLAELGFLYDSSIYPVRHDRYGVPEAPRSPFLAQGTERSILELPPALLRMLGVSVPAGGGGYFRLLPLGVMERAIRQLRRDSRPPVATLYFHPWEFDPEQRRLPLRRLSRFRTYVGIGRSRHRFVTLLDRYDFTPAVEVARELDRARASLPTFALARTA